MYSLCMVGSGSIYRCTLSWLTSYSLCKLSCAIYMLDRVELVAYILYMDWLAIYIRSEVGDMRHIRRGWGQHRSDMC